MSTEKENELLAEAAAYFRARPGLGRLLAGFVEKYRSLGRLGGKVILDNVSHGEKADLETFFRKRLPVGSLAISVQMFQQALAETRFGILDPAEILRVWNGGRLTSRQQERDQLAQARQEMIAKLLSEHPHPFCQIWLKAVLAGEPGTRRIQFALNHDERFADHIAVALRALGNLPAEYKRLPVFAREVSGDPHGLDIDNDAGKLFLDGLRYIRRQSTGGQPAAWIEEKNQAGLAGLSVIEEISELLYHFRLLRDDLLNFVTCLGLAAYDEQGKEIPYWRSAAQDNAPLNTPLREIVRAVALFPAIWAADKGPDLYREGFTYEVFVVENSGVYSALVDEVTSGGHAECGIPLICLHGQLKMASWALLDRLVHSGAILRYAGDFDPEGLQIADKLLLRYQKRVHLWHMSVADYRNAGPAITMDRIRLSKLKSVKSPALAALVQSIETTGLAAYQEGLLEQLAADLRSKMRTKYYGILRNGWSDSEANSKSNGN